MSKVKKHILLIDDDEINNFLSREIINLYMPLTKVDSFTNPEEALEYIREKLKLQQPLPDIILLDINMPLMSGFEVAEEAAPLIAGKSSIVLVMLTSSGSPDDMERARSMKIIKGYVTKPLGTAAVSALLEGAVPTFDGKS